MKNQKKNEHSKKTRWSILCHPIILALLLGTFVILPYDIYQLYTVDKYGIETVATVYKTTRRSGRKTEYYMYYEFQAGRKWYKAKKSMDKKEYSKGDTLKIKYLPENPEVNFTVNDIDYHKKILPFWD